MTAQVPRAILDGQVLDTNGPVGWTFQPGTSPHRRSITLDRDAAEAIYDAATPFGSTLQIEVPGFPTLTVERLTVFTPRADVAPHLAQLELADLRWVWAQRHCKGHFNMRRRTGERRRPGSGRDVPAAIQPLAADVSYASYSLFQGQTPWTAEQLLREVLRQVLVNGEQFDIRTLPSQTLPVENLALDDSGGGAIGRALSYFGGVADVVVDAGGRVTIYDRTDQSERLLVGLDVEERDSAQIGRTRTRSPRRRLRGLPGPPQPVGPPLWDVPDRQAERPSSIRVGISRLVELRFDFTEANASTSGSTTTRDDPPLDLENVLPAPDFETEIPALNGRPARTVLQGTWITIEEALAAWNALGWADGGANGEVTLEILRGAWFGQRLSEYTDPLFDEDGLIARRVATLFQHYRQTFRIRREWRDRLGQLFPIRVELLDSETGTKAPAEAYADYAVRLTQRRAAKTIDGAIEAVQYGRNVPARGSDGLGGILDAKITDMRPNPAVVQILDDDEGILRLNYGIDPRGGEAEIVFCAIDDSALPTTDLRQNVITFDQGVFLRSDFEVSIVLATVPVAPQGLDQLHQIVIGPDEAAQVLGLSSVGECRGPEAFLRIQPMNLRSVARHRWDDDRADLIREAFRVGDVDGSRLGEPLNPGELSALAQAAAGRFYARLLSHVEGQLTTGLAPGIEVTGVIGGVSHQIDPKGRAFTTVGFPRDLPQPDTFALLPESVRQVVLGEVLP